MTQYNRHKQAAVTYVRDNGIEGCQFEVRAIDAKHDRLIPDGILVLLEDQNGDRLTMLLHEQLAEVAQDTLDENAWEKGTAG